MPLTIVTDINSWCLLSLAAFCIGISKAGFSGASIISVFLFAEVLGAKASVGFALPMLIMADLTVYPMFRKYASWKAVLPLIWPACIGLVIGFTILSRADDEAMRKAIGIIILLMVTIQLLSRFKPEQFKAIVSTRKAGFTAAITGGIATTLANAAGPVLKIYLVSLRMEKMQLLGISARFFLLINIIKLPFSSSLNLINTQTIIGNIILSPIIALGVYAGFRLVKITPQKLFESLVIIFAIFAGLGLYFY